MKATTNPLYAKIRLFLIILAFCMIVTCLFLIIIHPEAWMIPACTIAVMVFILLYQWFAKRKKN